MCVWTAKGSSFCEKFPLRWRRTNSPGSERPLKKIYLSCTSNALQSRFLLLGDLGVMESLFQRERVRKTNSFCSKWQALPCLPGWGFILASHGDICPLLAQVFVPGTADIISGTELPLLLPLHCQQSSLRAGFWEMFRCVIFHPLAPCFVCSLDSMSNNMLLLPTRAQCPSQGKEELLSPSFFTLSLHHFRT